VEYSTPNKFKNDLIPKQMKKTKPTTLQKTGIYVLIIAAVIIPIQFCTPGITKPPVAGKIKAPENVNAILKRACGDCHSNENNLRWYDKLAPVSWLVNSDIKDARKRLNLSNWDSLSVADQQADLWEMVNMIETGKMPLAAYTLIHPSAKVYPEELTELKRYVNSLNKNNAPDTTQVNEADKQFVVYQHSGSQSPTSAVAADGVRYISGYQDWQVISTTNRFDNNPSIRVVYGNSIAVRAIKKNHITPWPNGTTIVKVVWNILKDKDGHIRPGTFNNVQIMTKNDKKFLDTKGWGFAKFNGLKLLPYGKTAAFNTTCFHCHELADANGYVFNVPLKENDLR
jgi:hypothetical protein